jgi:hypothetical protein
MAYIMNIITMMMPIVCCESFFMWVIWLMNVVKWCIINSTVINVSVITLIAEYCKDREKWGKMG